jgi:hypothetical protein
VGGLRGWGEGRERKEGEGSLRGWDWWESGEGDEAFCGLVLLVVDDSSVHVDWIGLVLSNDDAVPSKGVRIGESPRCSRCSLWGDCREVKELLDLE